MTLTLVACGFYQHRPIQQQPTLNGKDSKLCIQFFHHLSGSWKIEAEKKIIFQSNVASEIDGTSFIALFIDQMCIF